MHDNITDIQHVCDSEIDMETIRNCKLALVKLDEAKIMMQSMEDLGAAEALTLKLVQFIMLEDFWEWDTGEISMFFLNAFLSSGAIGGEDKAQQTRGLDGKVLMQEPAHDKGYARVLASGDNNSADMKDLGWDDNPNHNWDQKKQSSKDASDYAVSYICDTMDSIQDLIRKDRKKLEKLKSGGSSTDEDEHYRKKLEKHFSVGEYDEGTDEDEFSVGEYEQFIENHELHIKYLGQFMSAFLDDELDWRGFVNDVMGDLNRYMYGYNRDGYKDLMNFDEITAHYNFIWDGLSHDDEEEEEEERPGTRNTFNQQKLPPTHPSDATTCGNKRKPADSHEHKDGRVTPEKRSKSSHINQYSGWEVPTNGSSLTSINADDVTPEVFYNNFIKQRRPVVLKGVLPDLSLIDKWKDLSYLEEKVGDQSVMVEQRGFATDSFGKGNEIRMTFKKFLHLIKEGDDKHYLTTQDILANSDGRPDLIAPFMKPLKADFPLRPALVGNLVPQNINMWIGNNKQGASSGLHHDYHDNLYIVLKGRKRFRLYSPMDTEKMYTRGELLKVHPNGRINYKEEETTAYGADLQSDAAALAARYKDEAEKMLEEAEHAVQEGNPGALERMATAEKKLDEAMDKILEVEMADDGDVDESGACAEQFEYGDQRRLVDKTVKNPNNFSKLEVNVLDDKGKLEQSYPKFLDAKAAFCDIEAGSILYLPASWFHEVTSYGAADGHLAVNFWFHPPDGKDFDAPYSTGFWSNDYKDRLDEEDKQPEK